MSIFYQLDFESDIREIEQKIVELKESTNCGKSKVLNEISVLEEKRDKKLEKIYANLTPWQKVQIARHPDRPKGFYYINAITEDFFELSGDRCKGNDRAIVAGIAKFRGRKIMIAAQEKGHDSKTMTEHNFGMPLPEGYRKLVRVMKLANELNLPFVSLVDTAGASPGIEAEEGGQGHAIASAISASFELEVPNVSVIIGEGGSGGAVALACANSIIMNEHSIYSTISPEGCSAILWKNKDSKKKAAEMQKLTAQDLLSFGLIDKIIDEPLGGAHRNKDKMCDRVANCIEEELDLLSGKPSSFVKASRAEKFKNIHKKYGII
ncbi:acetyl-CoA carboxylase carboxyltransferase subunit alpha [Candidatus Nesciobacter abundans]|uniref:Acetyl-coenzyme A carboxylase carboxyl transferase subunit alpha n=1 Tax=Candidatus Nesciobacter abundans TaxID=2601668 RepID=A0A5C0UJM9_9PROT|nr:acetyl-CoA carboxylase carboxyltransferase subunit alpha [Candidatus Nesciobacter abundans]QEK39014.1 acetyl-CoA carboxylase carboxyltransferase subunit alpha [Candidatus Nesciobacter abundans]